MENGKALQGNLSFSFRKNQGRMQIKPFLKDISEKLSSTKLFSFYLIFYLQVNR